MKIYLTDINNVSRDEITCWYKDIENTKKGKIDNIKDATNKSIRIVSDHLSRYAVSKHLNINPKEITFCYGKHGKPLLSNGNAYFNISHSGNYIVCCVDDLPCGIDVEIIKERKLTTSKRFCTENELQYISNSVDKNIALLEIWTKKEAYFKSFGCGIATCLSSLDTLKTDGFNTIINDKYVLSIYSENVNNTYEIINHP